MSSNFKKKLEKRKGLFKKKNNEDSSRSKRNEVNISISKKKRESRLMKRRNIQSTEVIPHIQDLSNIIEGTKSKNIDQISQCVQQIRILLSQKSDPPIDIVIKSGIIPTFVEMLSQKENLFLQLETAWIFSNICSGNHQQTKFVVDHGIIPIFIELLDSNDLSIVGQSIWALGNISGDCDEYRLLILNNKIVIPKLVSVLSRYPITLEVIKLTVWTLSLLFKGNAPLAPELCQLVFPIFSTYLQDFEEELLIDSCWGMSYICHDPENIQRLISEDSISRLIQLLEKDNDEIIITSIRILSGVLGGTNKQTEFVLQAGILKPLKKLIRSPHHRIVKETCFALSNITAGTEDQIQLIIDEGFTPEIIDLFSNENPKIRREVCWIMCNAINGGNTEQIEIFIEANIIEKLCAFLLSDEIMIVKIVLEAYQKMLGAGVEISKEREEKQNIITEKMDDLEITSLIEKISESKKDKISKIAQTIQNNFFYYDDFYEQNYYQDSDSD
ncbi:importin subunit alpha-4 [Anaeramoeba flamelloides]|uniref:Importin subunit alpha n=1 Tax=Anaeramoeba flamelloides TaxID=1746091 RepID=A0AAV7ZVS6_9EUKA|nr:importin subunit alpha-4 [Anaeramoeba flamelloides]